MTPSNFLSAFRISSWSFTFY